MVLHEPRFLGRRLDLGPDWLRAVCWHNPLKLVGDRFPAPA